MNIENKARQQAENAIREAAEKLPDFLTREDLRIFSGKAFSVGHLSNMDSRGEGPKGGFYLGRRTVYPKKSAIEWLISRVGFVGKSPSKES
jgi:hypothetical protein